MKDYKILALPASKLVVAIGTYRGENVRATARCHPNDDFDEALGVKLAVARLEKKLALKRISAANARLDALHAKEVALDLEVARTEAAIDRVYDNLDDLMVVLADADNDITDLMEGLSNA